VKLPILGQDFGCRDLDRGASTGSCRRRGSRPTSQRNLPRQADGINRSLCLVAAGRFGEAVHLLEAEDSDRPWLLLRPRIVSSDPDSLEGVEVADFVGDRVLGHRRQRAEDADGAGGGATFGPQHVVDQDERVAAAQLP
jgi:hypothetical protein